MRGNSHPEAREQPKLLDRGRPAGIPRPAIHHAFRHSGVHPALCGTAHLLEAGYDIRTIQELLGREDLTTTMIDTHVLNKGGRGVRSPVDGLRDVLCSLYIPDAGGSPDDTEMSADVTLRDSLLI